MPDYPSQTNNTMKTPYVFDMGSKLLPQNAPPVWCKHSLAFAGEQYRCHNRSMDFVLQRYTSKAFHLDLIQLNSSAAQVRLPFVFGERRPLLHFMLEGGLLVATTRGEPIVVTRGNTFLMGYADAGNYMFQAAKGRHVAMVITLLPKWLGQTFGRIPTVRSMLDGFYDYDTTYQTMYHCRLDAKTHRWLRKICAFPQPEQAAVEANLLRYLSHIIEYYDRTCSRDNRDLAFRVKTYLHAHYNDKSLNVKQLAAHFATTERTLLNNFKRQYGMGILQYYTNLRMAHALFLMQNRAVGAKEVYALVGYADEGTFKQALARYLGSKME